MMRFGLALRAYDPNQPRVPAGDPDGGRWTDGGFQRLRPRHDPGRRDDEGRVRVAGGDDDKWRYRVNLYEEEAQGGHTISRHVRRSDANLLADVRFAPIVPPPGKSFREIRVGSFSSIEVANDLVNHTLEENKTAVDAVASGAYGRITIERKFGHVTGREAVKVANLSEAFVRNTFGVKVVLESDRRSSRGYRVLTAFPVND